MDYIKALKNLFEIKNRYENWGDILLGLKIKGIKGTNCNISFDFPVTAISGFNGAGKSTIAQIALCAYKSLAGSSVTNRKYLKDFFVKTLLDKQPYKEDAAVIIKYATSKQKEKEQISLFSDSIEDQHTKTINMYYAIDRWAGYKYQPARKVFYYGMSSFIPYQEQNSNLLGDSKATVTASLSFKPEIVNRVADILSINYSDLQQNNVRNEKREEQVISALKGEIVYSENHMGCGEGRLLKLVDALENAPDKSLFVIEEPETALHQLAQHKLSQYFMDVCFRKRHQIIFTTHSSFILEGLPLEARKHVVRNEKETQVVNNPTIAEVDNLLSGGHCKALTIVTEDEIGAVYIKEILRSFAPNIFENASIYGLDIGFSEIKSYVCNSQKCGFNVCGVVDENRRKQPDKFVIAFPENEPPEITLFRDKSIRDFFNTVYKYNCDELNGDHHNYFNQISQKLNEDEKYLKIRCIKEYVTNKGIDYFKEIIDFLKNCIK